MEQVGIDTLLVINHSNINYLTGYEGWSDYVPQALIVTQKDEEPRIILREMDVPCATYSAFMSPQSIFPYAEDFIAHPTAHPYDEFARLFERWGIANHRLGIELAGAPLTPRAWEKLQSVLPNAKFVDATGLVTWLRLKKSPAELAYMRVAGQIADLAMQAGIDAIKVGARQCDVGAAIMGAQVRGTPDACGDRPKFPHMGVGQRTSCPHVSWSDGVYKAGTPTTIELGGYRRRYVAGLSRTIYLGEPPSKLHDLHKATREGLEVTFETLRPGWACEDVEAAFRKTTRKYGFEKKSRLGYAIGIDWTEVSASLRRGDHTVLEPDMTFHLMCGMWYDDWGYVLSEAFRVTERGAESFSKLPRELFIK